MFCESWATDAKASWADLSCLSISSTAVEEMLRISPDLAVDSAEPSITWVKVSRGRRTMVEMDAEHPDLVRAARLQHGIQVSHRHPIRKQAYRLNDIPVDHQQQQRQ